jgi:Rad51
LRQSQPQDASHFGVRDLDELLNVFLNVRPSRQQEGRKPPVLEISSPSSGGGKSQLLYYLAVTAVLPCSFKGRQIGGRNGAVVLLDTDGRLDVGRLYDIAEGAIQHALQDATADTAMIAAVIRDALEHMHVFRPQTSSSLLSTLKSLDTYLLGLRHRSSARPLHAVLLDSASAFYWQDRMRDEVSRTQDIGRSATAIQQARDQRQAFYMNTLYADMATELRRIQTVFGCSVAYTTWGLNRAAAQQQNAYAHLWSGPPSFKPHLPQWAGLPDLRLVVQRDTVRPYPAAATQAEIQRDAPMRQGVVRRGRFSAWVDTYGREYWPAAAVDALSSMPDQGFPFWVRDDGVFMDDLMSDTNPLQSL